MLLFLEVFANISQFSYNTGHNVLPASGLIELSTVGGANLPRLFLLVERVSAVLLLAESRVPPLEPGNSGTIYF